MELLIKTILTDKGCFISNDVKKSIVLNLCESKSMDLIAREHLVSPTTVARILRSTEDTRRKKYLPRVLGIDVPKGHKNLNLSIQ